MKMTDVFINRMYTDFRDSEYATPTDIGMKINEFTNTDKSQINTLFKIIANDRIENKEVDDQIKMLRSYNTALSDSCANDIDGIRKDDTVDVVKNSIYDRILNGIKYMLAFVCNNIMNLLVSIDKNIEDMLRNTNKDLRSLFGVTLDREVILFSLLTVGGTMIIYLLGSPDKQFNVGYIAQLIGWYVVFVILRIFFTIIVDKLENITGYAH